MHYLRKHLAPEAIVSRGDELWVDRSRIACDAWDFEARLAEGRPREALERYGGDLLPGLDAVASPEFARWLEAGRDRLRRDAAAAAWLLAEVEEERRNWISAADFGRRAVRLSSGEEAAVRRLLRLLDRAGDRVAAIRTYERFERDWRRDHGVSPSAATQELADAIRSRSPSGSGADAPTIPRGGTAPSSGHPGAPGKLAVLPFLHTAADPKLDYLAAGVTHGLISSLTRLSSILVVARASVERYAQGGGGGDPPRPIADELGVGTILQGSVGLAGDRIVLSVQLGDARTGTPLWAEIRECDPSDLPGLQGELVESILDALGVALSDDERERVAGRPAAPAAYEAYLAGRFRLARRSKEELDAAIRLFETAIAADPDFALPQAALAEAYLLLWPIGGFRPAEARVRAREAARAALAADRRLGEAYATLGMLRGLMDRDWYGAEADFRRAVELSPGHATVRHWCGAYLCFVLRRPDEGLAELSIARELDPLSHIIRTDTGLALLHRGRHREAIRSLRGALDLEPDSWRAHHDLGLASFLAGDREAGVEHLSRAWRLGAWGGVPVGVSGHSGDDWRTILERGLAELDAPPGGRGAPAVEGAMISVLLGQDADAIERLRAAIDDGSWGVVPQYWPVFERLRAHAEFVSMLEEQGLRAAISWTEDGRT